MSTQAKSETVKQGIETLDLVNQLEYLLCALICSVLSTFLAQMGSVAFSYCIAHCLASFF